MIIIHKYMYLHTLRNSTLASVEQVPITWQPASLAHCTYWNVKNQMKSNGQSLYVIQNLEIYHKHILLIHLGLET